MSPPLPNRDSSNEKESYKKTNLYVKNGDLELIYNINITLHTASASTSVNV